MDIARLGLAVDSSQVEKGTVSLKQLTGAAGQASAAAQRLAGASQAEAVGQKAAAAAVGTHNAALMAQNTIMRSSMQQRTMMIYQLNDVAVSLASGMNPAMVAMQQGSQILQGGFAPALRTITDLVGGLVTKFWPLAAAVGAVTSVFAGLTYEFNKTAETQVSVLDVMRSAWDVFASDVANSVAPVFVQMGSWLQQGWDAAAPVLKDMGNAIIGTSQAISIVWQTWPAVMGDVIIRTVNVALTGITRLLNESRAQLAQFLSLVSSLPIPGVNALAGASIGLLGKEITALQFDNPYAGAGEAVGGAISGAMGRDYLGELGGAMSTRAQQIARARAETEALGGAAKAANDNVKTLAEDGLGKLGEFGKSVLSTLSSGFSDLFKGLLKGTKSAGDAIADLLGKLGDLFIDQAFNMLFGGLFGGGMGGGMKGGLFGGAIIPGILHSGGTAGMDGYGHGRAFGADTWANAPRYHNGGIAGLRPNEVPAILERGEKVIPANQNGGGGQTVVVIRLEDGLRADIVNQAVGQSVQISKGMVEPVSRTVSQMAQQQRYG